MHNFPRAGVTDSGFAPSVNLSFRPDDDTLLYAQVSKGFRAGSFTNTIGFSPLCTAELAQFGVTRGDIVPLKSDTLWSYEGGAKFSRMNRRLFVDTAIFYNQWSDLQQVFLLQMRSRFAVNAGKARSYGAELSLEARPSQGLTLGLRGRLSQHEDHGERSARDASRRRQLHPGAEMDVCRQRPISLPSGSIGTD